MTRMLALLIFASFATGCSGFSPGSSSLPRNPAQPFAFKSALKQVTEASPIQYVVVIFQENRTFDNFFYGFPHADYAKVGQGIGKQYPRNPITLAWKFRAKP